MKTLIEHTFYQNLWYNPHHMSHEFSSGHGLNPSQDAELREQEAAKREAAELISALKEKEGKKALAIVVDDEADKRGKVEQYFIQEAAARDTGYVLSLKQDGASAIRLYQAFREQESREKPNKVVVLLDGILESYGPYQRGDQVANKLIAMSTENGWEAPYLVGISTLRMANNVLKDSFPEQSIASFHPPLRDFKVVFDAIDAKL
jgi:hypothetical protein